jgi:hypothetical protein
MLLVLMEYPVGGRPKLGCHSTDLRRAMNDSILQVIVNHPQFKDFQKRKAVEPDYNLFRELSKV